MRKGCSAPYIFRKRSYGDLRTRASHNTTDSFARTSKCTSGCVIRHDRARDREGGRGGGGRNVVAAHRVLFRSFQLWRGASSTASSPTLVFDLPRRLSREEKQEVHAELESILEKLPATASTAGSALTAEDIGSLTKINLICGRLAEVGLEQTLILLNAVFDALRYAPSDDLRMQLVNNNVDLGIVLRAAYEQRFRLSPKPLRGSASVALALLGDGSEAPTALAEGLLEAMAPFLGSLPFAEVGDFILCACTRRSPPLPQASRLLQIALMQLSERLPADFSEQDITALLAALGGSGIDVDPIVLEDLLGALEDVWPLCSASTLLSALLNLGQAGVLDVTSFRMLVGELQARVELLGSTDRESLLLLLSLHKGAFDRAATLPNPLYDRATKDLVKALAKPYATLISSSPLEALARPVLALTELRALDGPTCQMLEERLASGQLLSLSPSTFAALAYAHRLRRGPVPREYLRNSLTLAFGAKHHTMHPRQIASCLESLWQYASKSNRNIFASAFAMLARALEAPGATVEGPHQVLTPIEAASVVTTYSRIRFEDVGPLLRMLNVVAPQPALHLSQAGMPPERRGLLSRMPMNQLVDILEAFGRQGLSGCSSIAAAIVQRFEANGGRISRRNVARSFEAVAQLGERPPGLLGVLLGEVDGWMERDPAAADMKAPIALTTLWSICALSLASRSSASVDWLLGFLCTSSTASVFSAKRDLACMLFESLGVLQLTLPAIAQLYLRRLAAQSSHIAPSLLLDTGAPSTVSEELLALSANFQAVDESVGAPRQFSLGVDAQKDSYRDSGIFEGSAAASALVPGSIHAPAASSTNADLFRDTDVTFAPDVTPPEETKFMLRGRSALDELGVIWQLRKRRAAAISQTKQALGEIFSLLNVGRVLRGLPHPDGPLSAEAARLSGGFVQQWAVGPYDVDWGNPHLRIGVIVLNPRDFAMTRPTLGVASSIPSLLRSASLLAPQRLRVQHAVKAAGWRLVLLRAEVVQTSILASPAGHSVGGPFARRDVQEGIRRANATYPLNVEGTLRQLRRASRADVEVGVKACTPSDSTGSSSAEVPVSHQSGPASTSELRLLADRLAVHFLRQLEIVFPDSVVRVEDALGGFEQKGGLEGSVRHGVNVDGPEMQDATTRLCRKTRYHTA
eukprot:TRINITY_DN39874_c0_g1_i1.p1 TRINITY_DN39874_c0_g1~~TRINITY_DN39874_c0_g1_i1.p1  ORF type:complete len:1150 (+),score=153.10 TRINITY_DN39874_c0_g1_i1:76-3525(+)